MTEPTPYWTRGDQYHAPEHIAIWTREHATWEVARTKGPRVGTTTYGAYVWRDGDTLRLRITPRPGPAFTGNPAPEHPLDGFLVGSMEEAERVLFDEGIWAFQETIAQTPPPGWTAPHEPDPEDLAYDRQHRNHDPQGWIADAAAADMVYGKGT